MKRLLAFVCLFPALHLSAQTPAPPALSPSNGLALDECLKLADGQQPALAAAAAGEAAAGEAVGEAKAPYYPQVDFNAGYHRWQRHAFLPSGLVIPGQGVPDLIGPLNDWNGGVASRLTLFDGGERRAGFDAARARLAGAAADTSATRADVRLNVQTAFYAVAAAQDLQAVAKRNFARTEAHLRLAEARHASGAVPSADVFRMQAEVANARLEVINAASRVRVALGRLNTAMGRAASTPLTITPPPPATPPPDPAALDAAVGRALDHRPEITAGEKRTEAARAAVQAARAARAPKVRADAAFGWRDTVFLPDTQEWQAGLSIDLPLFDAGSRAHHLARSKAELAREEAGFESRRLQIREEAWSAAAEVDRAWAVIAANESAVLASEESLRVVRERYENGAAVITDLLDTQTTLARAESSLAEARWNYLAARAMFDRAVGAGP